MLELRTETEIDAPVERVWQVLMDFDSYPRWNPFIRSIRGTPEVGSRLEVEIGAPGTRPMRFRPTVRVAVRNRGFRRLWRLVIAGLLVSEHFLIVIQWGSTIT